MELQAALLDEIDRLPGIHAWEEDGWGEDEEWDDREDDWDDDQEGDEDDEEWEGDEGYAGIDRRGSGEDDEDWD